MATLHIEHPITDLPTWLGAFRSFAPLREAAGVRAERVRVPQDGASEIVVDLDFATPEEAAAFLEILRTQVWSSPERAPALAGTPLARVLEDVAV